MQGFESLYDIQQLQIRTFDMNYDLSQVKNLPWSISDLGKNGQRVIDTDYRRSVEHFCTISATNIANRFTSPNCWKVLKYENGFFKEHVDHQVNLKHKGIQILLPPLNQCSYEGGQLIVKDTNIIQQIKPHESQWTWIYLPLGMIHQVRSVKGTRISFVRVVNGKNDFIYDRKAKGIEAIAIQN